MFKRSARKYFLNWKKLLKILRNIEGGFPHSGLHHSTIMTDVNLYRVDTTNATNKKLAEKREINIFNFMECKTFPLIWREAEEPQLVLIDKA